MMYFTGNRFILKWRNLRIIDITLKWGKVIPCDNITLPHRFPWVGNKGWRYSQQARDGVLAGAGAQVSSVIWGSSISGPQFFNLQNEGLGITESLCHLWKADQNGNIPSGYSVWLRAMTFSNSLSQRLGERKQGSKVSPVFFLVGFLFCAGWRPGEAKVSTPGCFLNSHF